MNREKRFKKLKPLLLVGAITATSISCCYGCSKKEKPEVSYETKQTIEANETPVEIIVENDYTLYDLNINDDLSIETVVNESYEKYQEFYDDHGISKNEIRDMIFVINDKYTDKDGNLIIDEDRAQEAYSNICRIEGNVGSAILQKMDNINTIEYEGNSEVGKEVKDSNSWKIAIHPSLIHFIDKNISGGEATAEKIQDFEDLRDYEIELMNTEDKYDRKRINKFVKNMEITEYNSNTDNMDNINGNGQRYLLDSYKNATLQFAAKANPEKIYLKGYSSIEKNIKINATNEERFLENDVITLIQEGFVNADVADSLYNNLVVSYENAYTIEEEELLNTYGVTGSQLSLFMGYAHYKTTMADHKYQKDMCDEQNETIQEIKNIKELYSSSNKKTLKYEID